MTTRGDFGLPFPEIPMKDTELEQWVDENPALANAVFPTLVVLGAVTMQACLIALISWFLYIHSF